MTVSQILEDARNNLNAVSDSFWSDNELLYKLYRVMLKVARETRCIENIYTTTTTASTAEYTKPTRSIEIWRVTYNGTKLQLIDHRQYDSINPNSASSSGTPGYYFYFDDTLTLYPTPGSAVTLKIWSYDEPSVPGLSSTLEIPTQYHDVLVDGLTSEMCPKDLGHPLTIYWAKKYSEGIREILAHRKRSKRGDRMAIVKLEENNVTGEFGIV